MEEWRIIYDYTNYSVSNYGQVRNNKTGKILKSDKNSCGYLRVKLSLGGIKKMKFIHRLVAIHFLPNYNNYSECDHINNVRSDNRYFNLHWISRSNNIRRIPKKENTSSKYKGVHFCNIENKWRTCGRLNGKFINIGYFKTEKDAGIAFNDFIINNNLQKYTPLNLIK